VVTGATTGGERERRGDDDRTAQASPTHAASLARVTVRSVLLVVAATDRELALLDGHETFCCGIGPVEAALQTARVLVERRPDTVVHVGIAGSRTLAPPALVLGSEAIYCDVIDPASTLPRVERVNPDLDLLERARAALPEAHVLPIATCGKVGAGTGYDIEAMEGFGVLRACDLAGVPAVELRAISNSPEEADRSRWRFDEAFAALAVALDRLDVV
jgi:predicted 5'-methylthioadenosine/S-adenosylhomocysteine nucleosidase